MDASLKKSGFLESYIYCEDYVLTVSDKRKIKNALGLFIEAYTRKMASFDPSITPAATNEVISQLKKLFNAAIDEAKTIKDVLATFVLIGRALSEKFSSSSGTTGSNNQSSNSPSRSGSRHHQAAGNSIKLRITNYDHYLPPLAPQGRNTYYVKNMFDGNANTAWSISLDNFYGDCDQRWGPEFDVNAQKLDYIRIQNGYCKSETSYKDNTRANWITIFRVEDDDDSCGFIEDFDIIYSGPLRDTMEFQTLRVSPEFDNSRPTVRVGINFGCDNSDFYLGRKYRDLSISEMEFYGIPLR